MKGRSVFHWVCVFVLGAVALVGCTDVFETVALSVMTTEAPSFGGADEGPPLEGVEVCETDTDNCAVTNANGRAAIDLPANQEISYTVSKDGYAPWLVRDVTDETLRPVIFPMFSDALWVDEAAALMIAYPWTSGRIELAAFPLRAGVTYDLLDETAKRFYRDEANAATLDLTATTTSGRGGFVEVPPGEYQVEFGGTATSCRPDFAWPGDAANRITVLVRVGYISDGTMNCD